MCIYVYICIYMYTCVYMRYDSRQSPSAGAMTKPSRPLQACDLLNGLLRPAVDGEEEEEEEDDEEQ